MSRTIKISGGGPSTLGCCLILIGLALVLAPTTVVVLR